MDGLSAHRMISVNNRMKELDIFRIINIAASPDLNAIETCFAQVKRKFKMDRLNALLNEREFDVD